MPDFSNFYDWSSRSYECRLHVGSEAIENRLKEEVIRAGAKRAFVICSPSIKSKTDSVERIQKTLGPLYAGYFDQIPMEAPYEDVVKATEAARAAGADLLISLGAGTVVVATRVINIYLCETGDHAEMATQYPEGKPAFSPRLNAPKLPTINIVTTPTGGMNRGGQGVASPHLPDQTRLEYFDPKTRPVALIWDHEAIMATPLSMMKAFCVNGYISSALGAARGALNPIEEANHNQINLLHKRAYHRMLESPDTIDWRLDLFASAFLGNRSADDSQRGAHMRVGEIFDNDYGLATALHIRYPHVWQQDAGSALRPTVIRRSRTPSAEALNVIAEALSIKPGKTAEDTQQAIAAEIERVYQQHGMPTSIRELNVSKEDIPAIAKDTVKVFNSNAGMRDEEKQTAAAIATLEAAY
jgi:alcohol dehydrogenase class IV